MRFCHRSIFNTIGKYASENDARMVIMGTHGIKGMQKAYRKPGT
jgi:hypothetical protein